ncbi:MAG: polymerase protein [Parcubacteria group bacterium GW2011_GWA2_47_7]|nr:MAG: polymerase protein [Parcubacteria group bacterium GW2011_GWA2_47_7]
MVTKTHAKRLVLFDAHAIVHRAYHALPDFKTLAGEPTGGLYGLSTMLIRSIQEFSPDYMAACYDLPGPTFRHKEYKDYKAGRVKADEELKQQLERSRDIFTAFHIPIYDKPGFEADDMLGTIVEQLKKEKDLEILIVTGDMDTLQLVSGKRVRVYTLRKGINDTVVYDEEKVMERFGFYPLLLPDYKGLRGDPSDNIIGIAGIGEKTGSELMQKFGSIEGIYKALKKNKQAVIDTGIKPRIVELLIAGEEDAHFSKMLATIRRDAPIVFMLPKKTWPETFTADSAITLFNQLEFKTLGARVKLLLSKGGDAEVVMVNGKKKEKKDDATFFAKEEVYDQELLRKTAIGLWILNSDLTTPGIEEIKDHTGEVELAIAHKKIIEELSKQGLLHIYEDIELPLISILARAQEHGALIDIDYLKKLSLDYHQKLTVAEKAIYKEAGEEFNINSPKQLGVILFDKMQLTAKGLKKTAGGARSTRESELEKMKDAHPIIASILSYRELQKLLSTYIDNIPLLVDKHNRLHATLHQDGTTTGRFSSSNPNIQNIPVREGLGAVIRDAFIAPPQHLLIAFDYSQIEMRVLAMLSGDPGLTEIFQSGEDIHTSVASRVFRVQSKDVTKEMRRRAKVINFGIIYGMGVNALKTNLGSTREEAQEFYDQYFVTFPKIAAYFDEVKKEATKKGYTETIMGRRRYFPNLRSRLPFMKAMAERMAMNAPLQGTAADFVKMAMKKVDDALSGADMASEAVLILQVHDELIFEIKDDPKVIEKMTIIVRDAMTSVNDATKGAHIPLVVDSKIGKRWGSLV